MFRAGGRITFVLLVAPSCGIEQVALGHHKAVRPTPTQFGVRATNQSPKFPQQIRLSDRLTVPITLPKKVVQQYDTGVKWRIEPRYRGDGEEKPTGPIPDYGTYPGHTFAQTVAALQAQGIMVVGINLDRSGYYYTLVSDLAAIIGPTGGLYYLGGYDLSFEILDAIDQLTN